MNNNTRNILKAFRSLINREDQESFNQSEIKIITSAALNYYVNERKIYAIKAYFKFLNWKSLYHSFMNLFHVIKYR